MREIILKFVFPAIFAAKPNGKTMAILNGYTFYCRNRNRNTDRWVCTSHHTCKASFTATKCRQIVRVNLEHNHLAPKYHVHQGMYTKI